MKGAAALPQGLLDDFIRSTNPSPAAGNDETDSSGVSLEELFQPVRVGETIIAYLMPKGPNKYPSGGS